MLFCRAALSESLGRVGLLLKMQGRGWRYMHAPSRIIDAPVLSHRIIMQLWRWEAAAAVGIRQQDTMQLMERV